jgi:hypothetical protein
VWVDLENGGLAIEASDSKVNFAARYRADAAEILTQDEIRVAACECGIVQRIQLITRG